MALHVLMLFFLEVQEVPVESLVESSVLAHSSRKVEIFVQEILNLCVFEKRFLVEMFFLE